MKIALGSKVRDVITGLEGVAVGRSEYLFSVVQIMVQPTRLKDGEIVDGVWLYEEQLEKVD